MVRRTYLRMDTYNEIYCAHDVIRVNVPARAELCVCSRGLLSVAFLRNPAQVVSSLVQHWSSFAAYDFYVLFVVAHLTKKYWPSNFFYFLVLFTRTYVLLTVRDLQ